ncbi:MAG: ABC transporter permease, partial [Acidobacteriota bacterium]
MRRNPGFTIVAVLTLALGIGANTAIFTLVDRIMLASLPVKNPGELYRVGTSHNCCEIGSNQGNWGLYSYPLFRQFRNHTREFSQMAAFQAGSATFSVRRGGGHALPEPFPGELVSGNYFTMFGLRPAIGRLISRADDQPGAPAVAVMSYHAWRSRFRLDPSVIGGTFIIDTVPFTIVGVAPSGFFGDSLGPDPPAFWLPLSTEPEVYGQVSLLNRPGENWLYIVGRLKPNAKPTRVQSELTIELQHWLGAHPGLPFFKPSKLTEQRIALAPAANGVGGIQEGARTPLRLLMLITGLVLLIACANIANLLLARGAARRTEAVIRTALGAPRQRLIRQML